VLSTKIFVGQDNFSFESMGLDKPECQILITEHSLLLARISQALPTLWVLACPERLNTMNMADRYRRWFEYEKDANQKVLDSYGSVPEARRNTAAYQKGLDLFGHILAARKLWLYRFGLGEAPAPDLFSRSVNLEELAELAARMHAAWTDYYKNLDDSEVSRVFE